MVGEYVTVDKGENSQSYVEEKEADWPWPQLSLGSRQNSRR